MTDDYVTCQACGEVTHLSGLVGATTNDCPKCGKPVITRPTHAPSPTQAVLDFESDKPLVCNRDQTGDTTCEACQ